MERPKNTEPRIDEIIERASNANPLRSTSPLLEYLADCSDDMLGNFILEKLNSAGKHAKAIQVEQREMVRDLAAADVARIVQLARKDPATADLLLSRRGDQ